VNLEGPHPCSGALSTSTQPQRTTKSITGMSHPQDGTPPNQGWLDLVAWDEELYDPIFHGETSFAGTQGGGYAADYQLSQSYTSDPSYLVSAPPSIVGGPSSLGYAVSAPPSILGGQSSFEQAYGTSQSFGTPTTSPLGGQQDGQYFGSFGACDDTFLSPLGHIPDLPVLDTRYDRIPNTFGPSTNTFESTEETVFNPYVAGTSHSFSGLDVKASQVLNVGTWADQPHVIEPIAENDESRDEVAPISISQPLSQSYNSALPSYRRADGSYGHSQSRAITIPGSTRRPTSYNNRGLSSPSTHMAPPALSVSPGATRHPRSVTLSRSTSQARRKLATPSPTSDTYGWVSYHPDPSTNKLAPTSTEGLPGRARGRKKGLTAEQRSHAALMRIIGACSNCQRRKEKCDPGTPCKACLEYYKEDLVNNPCRDHVPATSLEQANSAD
jgi:hypothetical protein